VLEGRRAEPARGGDVLRSERLVEDLLELVLRDEREVEAAREPFGDGRLPRRRHAGDDDEQRRWHAGNPRGPASRTIGA